MKPEISTGHSPQFHTRIYQVCLFVLIPAIFISFIQPAEGIKCFCYDKEKPTCKGKNVVTCDKGVDACWYWMKDGWYEGAGCGRHWGNPNISCYDPKQDIPEDWCSCEKKDCCNAPDAKPGSCSPVSKKFLESIANVKNWAAHWAAEAEHGKALAAVQNAEGASAKKTAEAALFKAKAAFDKACKVVQMCRT